MIPDYKYDLRIEDGELVIVYEPTPTTWTQVSVPGGYQFYDSEGYLACVASIRRGQRKSVGRVPQ